MRTTTALVLLIILCGCGRKYTGLTSVDLNVTSITFHDSYPATITANLENGKPADFIRAAEGTLIASMKVGCSLPEDTLGMAQVNSEASFPLFYGVNHGSTGIRFEIEHLGLSWHPEYSIRGDNGLNRVYATARLENSTVQTWTADTVSFRDNRGNPVTTATGRITIRQGTGSIPWWDAPAGDETLTLVYGWPVMGRWNPLRAVYCPARGRVESWPGNVWESGDTLYFNADSLVDIDLTFRQKPRGYDCFLEMESLAEDEAIWTIRWPERLPRGADVNPGSSSVSIFPGESVTVFYEELY
ncbi:MAG TPA: hypothetical protein PLM22_09910 [Candidatus Sabulitectum sp.]|nr:hypothetical protein [Candidatus Sabulitectum sp.]HPJ29237.1 hypothetical protein [Candidatus Sabulitectum sp.]HPR23062.1 hypothetical protein [Candidatus Sabulitectum sp.]